MDIVNEPSSSGTVLPIENVPNISMINPDIESENIAPLSIKKTRKPLRALLSSSVGVIASYNPLPNQPFTTTVPMPTSLSLIRSGGMGGGGGRGAVGGGRDGSRSELSLSKEQIDYYTQMPFIGAVHHTRSNRSPPGMCGINNLGNTCFMNSMLQCLSVAEPLTNYFLADNAKGEPAYIYDINNGHISSSNGSLAHAYAGFVRAMWSGNFLNVSPYPLFEKIGIRASQFLGSNQHDSQELLSFLLDNLLEDLCRVNWPKPKGKNPLLASMPEKEQGDHVWSDFLARNSSPVADIFCGQFRSKLTCSRCGNISITYDPFTSVSVEIPSTTAQQGSGSFDNDSQIKQNSSATESSSSSSTPLISLIDCLVAFFREEQLCIDESVVCGICKVKNRASKELSLWRLPEILILHLKRFKVTSYRRVTKIDRGVNYPDELSLDPFLMPDAPGASHNADMIRSPLYDLFATSIHSGVSGGGHYLAHVFNFRTKQWALMDDASVRIIVDGASHLSKDAYVFFFRRRSAIALGQVVFSSPEKSIYLQDTETTCNHEMCSLVSPSSSSSAAAAAATGGSASPSVSSASSTAPSAASAAATSSSSSSVAAADAIDTLL